MRKRDYEANTFEKRIRQKQKQKETMQNKSKQKHNERLCRTVCFRIGGRMYRERDHYIERTAMFD